MYTQYLWPISPINPMQCFYGPAPAQTRHQKLAGQHRRCYLRYSTYSLRVPTMEYWQL